MDPVTLELVTIALRTIVNPDIAQRLGEVAAKAIVDLDLRRVAKASVAGSGAIAQGDEAVAAGEGGIAIGGDVKDSTIVTVDGDISAGRDIVAGDKASVKVDDVKDSRIEVAGSDVVTLPQETDFEKIATSVMFVYNQLEMSYRQTREQAQSWFRSSLIAASVGFLLVGIGIVAVILGQLTEGVITSISSIVPNVIAALFFLQSKAANERVDAIQTKLSDAREIQTAVEIANSVESKKARDKLKANIVQKVLGFDK